MRDNTQILLDWALSYCNIIMQPNNCNAAYTASNYCQYRPWLPLQLENAVWKDSNILMYGIGITFLEISTQLKYTAWEKPITGSSLCSRKQSPPVQGSVSYAPMCCYFRTTKPQRLKGRGYTGRTACHLSDKQAYSCRCKLMTITTGVTYGHVYMLASPPCAYVVCLN